MSQHYNIEIQRGGRVTIPVAVRRKLGLSIGDSIVLDVNDHDVRLLSVEQRVQEVRDLLSPYLPNDISLADQLVAERHAEAARETAAYEQSAKET